MERPQSPGKPKRFEIRRRLGAGGMGVVFEAVDHERNMRVALKALPRVEPQSLYRFKQEFRLLADITHPNLAALYELISDDDRWFLTMELVDGVDFLAHVRGASTGSLIPFRPTGQVAAHRAETAETGPFELPRSARWAHVMPGPETGAPIHDVSRLKAALQQLTSALTTLHNNARLHCDIKPSNVMVTTTGRVVVLDFGLATELEKRKVPRAADEQIYGSIAYMPPEQAAGARLTPACDWYAVGAMLYEALTGRLPFGGTPAEVVGAKQSELPPAPATFNPRVPGELNRLCLELLAPSPADRADGAEILRAIGTTLIPALSRDETASPIIGRAAQLAALGDAFASTRRGTAACVFVHGPSGLGKSALVEAFISDLSARDEVLILSGKCYEQESVQYKALDSLVDALSRHLAQLAPGVLDKVLPEDAPLLARMFPVLQRLPAIAEAARDGVVITSKQELRDRAANALGRLLNALSIVQPVVLCIDDLQWGDVDSAAIILSLLSGPHPPPVLFVFTYRSEYATDSACVWLLRGAPADAFERHEVAVDALTLEEATELAMRRLGGDALLGAHMASRIAEESRGSPYFVQALVEHVQSEAQVASGEVLAEGITLDEVLRRRTSRLRPGARRLLEVVSLAGRPLKESDAFSAAGLPTRDPGLLAVLRSGHLVRSGGGDVPMLETYHDRIRESVVAQLPAASLLELHRRLATTLEARGGVDPEWLGAHFQGAGEVATAGRYYAQAADIAATTLAFDRAAELYKRSLQLAPGDRWAEQSLRVRMADALANGGRSVQAAEVYQTAAREASGADALELERKAGYQFCIGGDVQQGRAVLEANLKRAGITLPATARGAILPLVINRARVRWLELTGRLKPVAHEPRVPRDELERLDLMWAVAASLADVDVIAAASLQSRHLVEAIKAQEPARIAAALALQVIGSAHEGVPARARTVRLLDVAQRFSDRVGTPYARAMTLLAQSIADNYVHRWQAAMRGFDEAEDLLRRQCTGVAWELSVLHMSRASMLRLHGQYAQMVRGAAAVLAEARQRGDLFTQARLGIVIEPDALVLLDDPQGARDAARRMRREWIRRQFPISRMFACFAEIEVDHYLERGRAGYRRVQRYWRALERSQLLRLEVIRLMAVYGRACLALAAIDESPGDKEQLIAQAEHDARRLERDPHERGAVHAHVIRAAIACHRGDPRRAIELLGKAMAWYDRENYAAFAASTRRYQGLVIGGTEGRTLVDYADAWFYSQGVRNPARTAAVHMPGFPKAIDRPSERSPR